MYIEVKNKETEEYVVTFTFLHTVSNQKELGIDNTVRIHVYAQDALVAIQIAEKVLTVSQAETMTDFISQHPIAESKTNFTIDEIEDIRRECEESGLFANWLMQPISAIQCVRIEDKDTINDLAIDEVMNHAKDVGSQAEDFLKNEENKGKE